jgi:EAL domain-containing protein (putative c-di-GMP-specific phosphodiesterase class I)
LLKTNITYLIEKEAFSHSYQYIYQVHGLQEVGAEFLFRAYDENPETIFYQAKEDQLLFDLDTKSIYKALSSYLLCGQSLKINQLFFNIYPSTILHNRFPCFIESILKYCKNSPNSIVLEIIESEKCDNFILLKERVSYLKEQGFQVAIDDVGKGWSSLSMIIELEPDYIKLDRYFSEDLSQSPQKQKMIKMLLNYFSNTKTKVILEGIEKNKDLNTANMLGIQLCQGYLLNRPQPLIPIK